MAIVNASMKAVLDCMDSDVDLMEPDNILLEQEKLTRIQNYVEQYLRSTVSSNPESFVNGLGKVQELAGRDRSSLGKGFHGAFSSAGFVGALRNPVAARLGRPSVRLCGHCHRKLSLPAFMPQRRVSPASCRRAVSEWRRGRE